MAPPTSTSLTLLLLVYTSLAYPHFTMVLSKLDQVAYTYPNKGDSLKRCEGSEVCGVVHNRPWYSPRVDRYCSCPDGKQCSTSTSADDPTAVRLNKRTLLKSCDDLSDMAECQELEAGLSEERSDSAVRVDLRCRCPWPGYWRLDTHKYNQSYSFSSYHCIEMSTCQVEEFCGYMRADTFSFYQQCLCPVGTQCASVDTQLYNTTEALYNGPSLKAFCRKRT